MRHTTHTRTFPLHSLPTYLSLPLPSSHSPQYLGFDQTISAPHMHAHALELLKDKCVRFITHCADHPSDDSSPSESIPSTHPTFNHAHRTQAGAGRERAGRGLRLGLPDGVHG